MNKSSELAAGQWWLHDNGKVMFIAFDERTMGSQSTTPIVAYGSPCDGNLNRPDEFVRRLPDDAGFDWKPEPGIVYPRWAVPTSVTMTERKTDNKEIAYYKFESEDHGVTFCMDGTSFNWFVFDLDSNEYQYTTQNAAEARIVKPTSKFVYPAWYAPDNPSFKISNSTLAYIRFDGNDGGYYYGAYVCTDGRSFTFNHEYRIPSRGFHSITRSESVALLKAACVSESVRPAITPLVPTQQPPSNQQLLELIAHLRDQMDRMASKIDYLKPPKLEPNQTAVRLWGLRDYLDTRGMSVLCCPADGSPPTNENWVEVKLARDGSLFVDGPPARCGFEDNNHVRCSLNSQHSGECKFE